MSLIFDPIELKEARKLELARRQPSLDFLPFSTAELLTKIHTDLFPDVSQTMQVYFVARGPLACIEYTSESASIYTHQLLNHSETPFAVMSLILKHELLHIRIPSTSENGKDVPHPPAFWAAQKAIAPERDSAWAWIWANLWPCLKVRRELQLIDVRANWRTVWNQPRTGIALCEQTICEQR